MEQITFCPSHTAHEEHFGRIDAQIREMKTDIDRHTEDISGLNATAAARGVKTDQIFDKLAAIEAKLEMLQSVPGKRWDMVVAAALTGIVGIALGRMF